MLGIGVLSWSSGIKCCKGGPTEGHCREIGKPGLCWVALRRLQVALEVDVVTGFSQVLYLVSPGAFLILLDVLGSIDPSDGSPVLQKGLP